MEITNQYLVDILSKFKSGERIRISDIQIRMSVGFITAGKAFTKLAELGLIKEEGKYCVLAQKETIDSFISKTKKANRATLIIHPEDESTVMLKEIYKDKDYDVITDVAISQEDLKEAIRNHDRIIMLGHGTGGGLIDPRVKDPYRHTNRMFIIDDSFADILREKETISVWCYSDQFFRRNNIKGFHTGMIISEPMEANYVLGECPLLEEDLFDNMMKFSRVIGECIDMSPLEMKEYVLANYTGDDLITRFNRNNIIVL